MLSKKEKILMGYIFQRCQGKESVLLTPDELFNQLAPKYEVSVPEINQLLNGLVLDHYITMIMSDKNGKPMYCVSLDTKGESFERDRQSARKTTINLIVRTVLLAILSTAVGLIIKAIIK